MEMLHKIRQSAVHTQFTTFNFKCGYMPAAFSNGKREKKIMVMLMLPKEQWV